jgi:RNA polymerase sigma-70 factor (ECF subfamily)
VDLMPLSFDEAFEAEFPGLYRYLSRRVGATLADDVASETFGTAFRNWERFDQSRPLRPWLYGIAANHLRHHWRSERRLLRLYARVGVDPVATEETDVEELSENPVLKRRLADCLARLKPRDRELLLLHAWAELSDTEIATALQIPIGTVKSRLSRVRGRLRNQLAADGQLGSEPPFLARTEEH